LALLNEFKNNNNKIGSRARIYPSIFRSTHLREDWEQEMWKVCGLKESPNPL